MRSIIIYNKYGWTVTSWGRGTAYELRYGSCSVFFQGDDAEDFRREMMDEDGWFHDHATELFKNYSGVMMEDSDRELR